MTVLVQVYSEFHGKNEIVAAILKMEAILNYTLGDNFLINYGYVAKITTHFGPHITVLSLVTCQSVVANFKMAAILDFHIWPTNINF